MTMDKMSQANTTPRTRRATSSSWQRHLQRAERQIGRGEYAAAVVSLQRAMDANADHYVCTLRLADLYRTLQQWNEAYSAAEKAVALSPARLPAYEMALAIALEAGDPERVIHASRALIKIDPRHLPAHNALGAVYTQLGDVDAAMRAASTLIRLDPQNASHHFKKALLCQHKGEIRLAVREFLLTIQLEPIGPHADAARDALETLDTFQLNQIATLAMEDMVFRTKLLREPLEAAGERGFLLSELGNQVLTELSANNFDDLPEPCRTILYN